MARKGAWLGTERGGSGDEPHDDDGGRVSRASARPQTTREEEMSLFGRPNAKPRGQIGKGLDVAA
jgi:hypothetical protein